MHIYEVRPRRDHEPARLDFQCSKPRESVGELHVRIYQKGDAHSASLSSSIHLACHKKHRISCDGPVANVAKNIYELVDFFDVIYAAH